MNILNVQYSSVTTMLIVVLLFALFSCNSSAQPSEANNELFETLIEVLIYSDSNGVHVENEEGVIFTYSIENEEFIQMLLYDRSTDFISFERCSTISNDNQGSPHRWTYELIVWDYENNRSKSLFRGESYNGEGLIVHYIYNYDWKNDEGIGLRYGWEWSDLTQYKNGKFNSLPDFPPIENPDILAFLDGNEIIVRGSDGEYAETYSSYLYNFILGTYTELSDSTLSSYNSIILSNTGYNINPDYGVNGRPNMSRPISWNNSGTAYLYSSGRKDNGMYGFEIFDVPNDKKHVFESGSSIVVKWRE